MEFYRAAAGDAIRRLESDPKNGLTDRQAQQRLMKNGENKLAEKKHSSLIKKFLMQFKDFMVITLLIAAGISFFTARTQGESSYIDPIIILGIVMLNAAVGVIQESKAEHAIDRLQQLSAPEATVIRSGKQIKIPSSQVVVGDILVLTAGDRVAADGRLIETVELNSQESALTGEAMPCEKNADTVFGTDTPLAERKNCVFASSTVLTGHGKAVVTHTGMDTQIGKIADMLGREEAPQTPLQLRLEKIGQMLGLGAVAICVLIFIMGVIRHDGILSSFMLAVSLAVAAIPEGLPAVVTIVLSVGVSSMAKRNAIIRRLTAVEALGSATVICSDKTGTLTQNIMTVRQLCSPYSRVDLSCETGRELLKTAAVCCNATASTGEPTETAIVAAAAEQGFRQQPERLKEIPFSSETKLMSVLVRENGRLYAITKGAPERVLPLCTGGAGLGGQLNDTMAGEGLRVLAVAKKEVNSENESLQQGLELVGLIGIEDPERPEAKEAVATCKQAGITTVMITGDNLRTACAIAKRLGIIESESQALTGAQLDKMSENELSRAVKTVRVYARVSPEHKVKIVKALRQNGEVTAMTGDGVNDAPALKAADIGCAMGKSGTQVAKDAADIVLADDNFATIVRAVREGRGIYDNIKKVVHFLLSSNVGEILLVLVAGLMHLPSPLVPIQLLWTNLVTDSLPAMALGVEKIDGKIMHRRPLDPKEKLFSGGAWLDIALEGMLVGALALVGFTVGNALWGIEVARTVSFCTLSLTELVHALNSRSESSLFSIGFFSNMRMNIAFAVCAALQLAVVTVDPLNAVFKTTQLNAVQWMTVAALSLFILITVEISKRIKNR